MQDVKGKTAKRGKSTDLGLVESSEIQREKH